MLTESVETRKLLEELPSGVHTATEEERKATSFSVVAYHTPPVEPTFPFSMDLRYPEMVLRGLATMTPSLKAYVDHLPKSVVDGATIRRPERTDP